MTTTIGAPGDTVLRDRIRALHRIDESVAIAALLPLADLPPAARSRVTERARALISVIRAAHDGFSGFDGIRDIGHAFLHEYDLSTHEGVALMCMAEALLRIPDAETADRLIQDKIGSIDWAQHVSRSDSLFVNASNWALLLTGRLINLEYTGNKGNADDSLSATFKRLLARTGEPLIRQAMLAAMRLLGEQFIMGRNIGEALEHAHPAEQQGYRHSYDMLGEAALSMADAQRYHAAYQRAIAAIGTAAGAAPQRPGIATAPSISIKLSALHPRYEFAQRDRVMTELLPAVRQLAEQAKRQDIGFTIDAEESDRLELSLNIVEALALDPALAGWQGLGLAVQAYQKRAPAVLDWLTALARRADRRLMVRLVKGAYWDSEIKLAQERGLVDYPVYTCKLATDIAYLACARKLLDDPLAFYPQFATHNAHSVASIIEMAASRGIHEFEFQRLHGMGSELYEQVVGAAAAESHPCRVYAPVGSHEELLAYLVRRLLENGANSSFVHRLEDHHTPIETLLADPVDAWRNRQPQTQIPKPRDMFGAERQNTRGLDLADQATLQRLQDALDASHRLQYRATPSLLAASGRHDESPGDDWQTIVSPADQRDQVGRVLSADPRSIALALEQATAAWCTWDATPAAVRAARLERAAELMEQRGPELIALIVREGGRTLPDAQAELREAADFCRYYAARARADFGAPQWLTGPTGETNQLSLHGRGVFACISPWNFPLAIFVGQVAAALAAGNAVVAKPAEQTPLIAAAAVGILHEAGIPAGVLQLLPGDGRVGATIVGDARIAGVAFTGSTETARLIARALAGREEPGNPSRAVPLAPLIAETGGLNVLIADSSALPEQLVRDVIASAFNSAGQRCSALRVLFVQADIADKTIQLLKGAMQELAIGNPALISTDIGPLIDAAASATLDAHVERLSASAHLIHRCELPAGCSAGSIFAPQAWEIDARDALGDFDAFNSGGLLSREVFGPILHVIRWQAGELDKLLAAIDASGYGLTLGIHSRIDATVNHIARAARVGNVYVNRNMIGAVVGVQPFGGERLSGTGPKAGGPHYLLRFATERCLTINTTAAGGNASLMSGATGVR